MILPLGPIGAEKGLAVKGCFRRKMHRVLQCYSPVPRGARLRSTRLDSWRDLSSARQACCCDVAAAGAALELDAFREAKGTKSAFEEERRLMLPPTQGEKGIHPSPVGRPESVAGRGMCSVLNVGNVLNNGRSGVVL